VTIVRNARRHGKYSFFIPTVENQITTPTPTSSYSSSDDEDENNYDNNDIDAWANDEDEADDFGWGQVENSQDE